MRKNASHKTLWSSGLFALVLAACLLLGSTAARAQDSKYQTNGWQYELTLYGWAASLSGHVGPAFKVYEVDESFHSILDYLDMAAMVHFEARDNRWGILVDPVYVNLGDSVDTPRGWPIKLNMEEFIGGLAGSYRAYQSPAQSFDFTFGGRYNEIKPEITPYLFPTRSRSLSWVDPVVGFKGGVKLGKAWTFGYRGDVGGFGAGSQLTWSAIVRVDAHFTKNFSMGLGYAYLYNDYKTGSGYREFTYDMAMGGPYLGVSFWW